VRGGDLYVARASTEQRISDAATDTGAPGYVYARWSPDGRHIAAVRARSLDPLDARVELLDRDGRMLREVRPAQAGIPDVSWSPDGDRLAIVAYLPDPAVAPQDQVVGTLELRLVGIDPGGDRLIPVPDRARSLIRPRPGPPTWVPVSEWSHDGRSIVVVGWGGPGSVGQTTSLWAIDADGGGVRTLVPEDAKLDIARFDLDAPGDRLAALGVSFAACDPSTGAACQPQVWMVPAGGGTPRVADPTGGSRPYLNLAWSPDGRRLALRYQAGEFVAPGMRTPQGKVDIWEDAGVRFELAEGSKGIQPPPVPDPLVDPTMLEDTPIRWLDDETVVYLSSGDGDGPGIWSIRRQLIGGGPPVVMVRDARTFDVVRPED
jgi:dipeptidyl aminopeptidase/acylaminoacyl peptidase